MRNVIDLYDIIYLLTNIFGTYTIYKFMRIFFDRKKKLTGRNELALYLFYYLLIGTIHILYNHPIINAIANIILFYLLASHYSSSVKFRITAVLCIYSILLSVEAVTIVLFSLMDFNQYSYPIDLDLILCLIISNILSYMVVLIISNLKMLKRGTQITCLQWFAVICIPLGTLFSTFVLMTQSNEENKIQVFISVAVLFLINFFTFYLYDILIQFYQEKMEGKLLKQQNVAYMKQLKIITQAQDHLKLLRHDFRLHVSTLQALIEKGNNEAALAYIQNAYKGIQFTNEYAKTGNIELDSILNYKISEAERLGIQVALSVNVPEEFNFDPVDIVIILGNLLDNAIEATAKVKGNKEIAISIEFDRNVLYIRVLNTFNGHLKFQGKRLKTTRSDPENHGLGLQSVEKSLEKYSGSMVIDFTDKEFIVDILLYNPMQALAENLA